jgi:hypothetical protein
MYHPTKDIDFISLNITCYIIIHQDNLDFYWFSMTNNIHACNLSIFASIMLQNPHSINTWMVNHLRVIPSQQNAHVFMYDIACKRMLLPFNCLSVSALKFDHKILFRKISQQHVGFHLVIYRYARTPYVILVFTSLCVIASKIESRT